MGDVLAFFDWEHSANGPTEAFNGRVETLRGIALGFRNLDNYITRSLLHAGGFSTPSKPTSDTCPYTPKSEEPDNLLYDEDATYSAFRPYQQN